MSKRVERGALEAVARQFSATVSEDKGLANVYLRIRGKRIAVQVSSLSSQASRHLSELRPRLRFDRVALGLVRRLRAPLQQSVPDGTTVIVTVTAPIRLPSTTAAAIEGRVRRLLGGRAAVAHCADRIHGNRVQIRLIKGGTNRTSKLVGFVHNPDSDPSVLFAVTRSLLASVSAGTGVHAGFAGKRWLVIANQGAGVPAETYRYVCAQLRLRGVFERMLVVLPGGGIETLTELPATAT